MSTAELSQSFLTYAIKDVQTPYLDRLYIRTLGSKSENFHPCCPAIGYGLDGKEYWAEYSSSNPGGRRDCFYCSYPAASHQDGNDSRVGVVSVFTIVIWRWGVNPQLGNDSENVYCSHPAVSLDKAVNTYR